MLHRMAIIVLIKTNKQTKINITVDPATNL